jgi:hypothetical protein
MPRVQLIQQNTLVDSYRTVGPTHRVHIYITSPLSSDMPHQCEFWCFLGILDEPSAAVVRIRCHHLIYDMGSLGLSEVVEFDKLESVRELTFDNFGFLVLPTVT